MPTIVIFHKKKIPSKGLFCRPIVIQNNNTSTKKSQRKQGKNRCQSRSNICDVPVPPKRRIWLTKSGSPSRETGNQEVRRNHLERKPGKLGAEEAGGGLTLTTRRRRAAARRGALARRRGGGKAGGGGSGRGRMDFARGEFGMGEAERRVTREPDRESDRLCFYLFPFFSL